MKMPINDHLDLLNHSFTNVQMTVFTGMSGSGKSTCIELLLAEHPDFAGQDYATIVPATDTWSENMLSCKLLVVDELTRPGELRHIIRLLNRGHALIVASHLHPVWVRFLDLRWHTAHFHTDRSTEKLQHFLHAHGVRFSQERLREFGEAHGANYTDLEIILERSGGNDFDLAFEEFNRSARIDMTDGR